MFTERLRFLQETQDEGNALLFQTVALSQVVFCTVTAMELLRGRHYWSQQPLGTVQGSRLLSNFCSSVSAEAGHVHACLRPDPSNHNCCLHAGQRDASSCQVRSVLSSGRGPCQCQAAIPVPG